ncbi:hypothetical protein PJKIFABJ_00137 [Pseudomonas phage PE09]|uniref:Uncharacterized protein n=2 Tax=Otagovirus TaxID=2560197 RepID=A0A7S7YCN9_9CAUD|nr:hypothetical protein QGX22_gp117 [Pseudomonas phage PE09]YP_010768424.1 hypothetical protein QGX23_gp115 [Pseudomonas phage PN09]QHZ60073.1 hypothetical protein PJKIFABJ_00137 [Pseudomonas phage PE09]QPB10537.1 hypothetical protein PN09_116 [Pseudomonas phage PN09]
MSTFALIFWVCVVLDCFVPGVDIAIGWYLLFIVLAGLENSK